MLLLLTTTVAVAVGAAAAPVATVWKIVLHQLNPDWVTPHWSPGQARIVWDIRFPRVVLGGLVGSGLAVVGAVLQAATRNPLADPYLFGVSAGAALGAVTVILHVGAFAGIYSLPLAAFAGALLSLVLVLGAARRHGAISAERLLLAGVAVAFIMMAATNFLLFLGDQRAAHSVVFWMLGGLGLARWSQLWLPTGIVVVGLSWLMLQSSALNALMAGEETAVTLGIEVDRVRRKLFAVSALVTGVLVAWSGAIGFVGLMIPHIVRRLIGGDNRRLLPLCALSGAIFLIWVDLFARIILAPQELPIGIITAALGGGFFIWLLRRA
ncbi:MAG: iron ABC transporter permease [Proteobacteria bacterium]|nr:iron ABC transporter permease [Pseudomonadota bacterium]